jgi:hypothetical protein
MEEKYNELLYLFENHRHMGYDRTKVLSNNERVVTLVDGTTPALNASQGSIFYLSAGGNRTIAIPTNPSPCKKIIIRHYANGGARTLSLNTGAGGFRFGSDVVSLTATSSGRTDYIGCIWNEIDSFWDVVAVSKNY